MDEIFRRFVPEWCLVLTWQNCKCYWASQLHFVLNLGSGCGILNGKQVRHFLPDDPKWEGLVKILFETHTWGLSENTHLFHQRQKEERAKLGVTALGLLFHVNTFSEMLMVITKFTLNLTPAARKSSLLGANVNKGISFHMTQIILFHWKTSTRWPQQSIWILVCPCQTITCLKHSF